jgi:polyisoprenoid-binding protein YceI
VDPARSELAFRVRRLVSTVRGRFARWSGTVSVDTSDWTTAQVAIDIETASIDTGDPDRDARLRAPDFFAADSFPVTTFRSTRIERAEGGRILLHAATIAAQGTIDRTRFGVTWNRVVEGTNVLGDDVELEIAMHLVRRETLGRR